MMREKSTIKEGSYREMETLYVLIVIPQMFARQNIAPNVETRFNWSVKVVRLQMRMAFHSAVSAERNSKLLQNLFHTTLKIMVIIIPHKGQTGT